MGDGRKSTRRVLAREAGDIATAEALTPPSERKLRDDERCGALTKAGTPCRSQKGSRTDHPGYGNCVKHGGNTEAGIKSAMREMGRDLITRYRSEVLRFGGDRRDPSIQSLTPESALLEEVRRSAAMVRFLEERIARWNLHPSDATVEAFVNYTKPRGTPRADAPTLNSRIDDVLSGLDPEDPDSSAYLPALTSVHEKTGMTAFTDAREWLMLYREERGHLARVSKMAIDAGVAQRLVSIAEDQGRILASAIRAVLAALNLSPEQAALVPKIVPPVLRAVAADQPVPDITSLTQADADADANAS